MGPDGMTGADVSSNYALNVIYCLYVVIKF